MDKHLNVKSQTQVLISCSLLIILFNCCVQAQNTTINIHLRGVYESKITLLPLIGPNAMKPVLVVDGIKNKETTILVFPDENMPGEFVLRFDYKENIISNPYPSEKRIIANSQDLELWVHPVYCNNSDSTWFQKDEKENTAYLQFLKENARQKEMLGLLQNFLLNYDDPRSSFYKDGISEYGKRRKAFNDWLQEQIKLNKSLFVSNMFGFQHIPRLNWQVTEADRKQSLRDNYFEGTDFTRPLMIKTPGMKEWMDGYVNLYGEMATSLTLRDSLFTLAGKNAIEAAKKGDPQVYGWMVDYFFNGYESFNITNGIKMLQPYLDDPNCLTSKRLEINKRLKGMETLVPGIKAPNIIMQDAGNLAFDLNSFRTEKKYILLLFWSADCSHCKEMTGKLYPWSMQSGTQQMLDIIAISVDETDTEVQAWKQKIPELNGWTHLRAEEGLRSKVADDYFILSVPVMILLDAKTKVVIALPDTPQQLSGLISGT
jgi:thioredoxin-related protein